MLFAVSAARPHSGKTAVSSLEQGACRGTRASRGAQGGSGLSPRHRRTAGSRPSSASVGAHGSYSGTEAVPSPLPTTTRSDGRQAIVVVVVAVVARRFRVPRPRARLSSIPLFPFSLFLAVIDRWVARSVYNDRYDHFVSRRVSPSLAKNAIA